MARKLTPTLRWLRNGGMIVGGGLVAIYVLYLVVANVVLRTRILRDAVGKYPERSLEYGSAYTLWPGYVHIHDVRLRIQDFNLEFLLVVDDAWVNLDLGALLSRRVHAKQVVAHGISFRYRARMEPGVSPAKTYALPPIEGFEAVPINPYRWKLPEGGFMYRFFTFDLENVVADGVREVWIQDYRLTGDGRAVGRFHLKPTHECSVGPAQFELFRGDVTLGGTPVLTGMSGTALTRIALFDPRDVSGNQAFRVLTSADVTLDAKTSGAEFVEHRYLGGATGVSPVRLGGGGGALHLDAHVRNGALSAGTTLTLQGKDLGVGLASAKGVMHGAEAKVSFDAEVHVRRHEGVDGILGFVTLAPAELRLSGATSYPIVAQNIGVFARSEALKLEDPLHDLAWSVDAPDVNLTDLRALQRLWPRWWPLHVDKGAARAHFHMDAMLATLTGEARVTVATNRVAVTYGKLGLVGKLTADVPFRRLDLRTLDADLSHATVSLVDVVQSKGGNADGKPWWGTVTLDKATLHPSQEPMFRATASISLLDLRPILSTYAEAKEMPGFVRDMLSLEGFSAWVVLRAGRELDVDDFRAKSDESRVFARYHTHGKHPRGAVLLNWKGFALGLELDGDDAKPILVDVPAWFAKQH